MKFKTLILEPSDYSEEALNHLSDICRLSYGPLSRLQLKKVLHLFEVLVVRLGHKIDQEIIDNASNLRVIASPTTGLNHIDCQYAANKNIKIISLQGETEFLNSIYATAEHTWAILLSLIRLIPHSFDSIKNYDWKRDDYKGSELFGKTLGIIGYGRIGKKVAKYAKAFGMNVITYDNKDIKTEDGVEKVELNLLLRKSNVISIHIPDSPATHEFIDRRKIGLMRKDVILINTSRGEVIEESALLEALEKGDIKGAALDVLSGENKADADWLRREPLLKFARSNRNLLLTPHLGGCTIESMVLTETFMANKLKKWLLSNKNDLLRT